MASPSVGPDPRMAEWGRSLLWLNLLATAVVFSPKTTEAFELPKTAIVRGVGLALAVGLLAVWAAASHRRRRLAAALAKLPQDWVALGVLLSLAAAVVSTATSVSPRTSLLGAQGSFMGLGTLTAYAVLFFATRSLSGTPDAARGVLTGGLIGLALAVAYGAVQIAGLDPLRWEAPIVFAGVRRVFSTQGHPNSFAQLLVVGTPLVGLFLARALRARRHGEAALLGLLGIGALALTGLTLSRAGALALAAGGCVAIWGWRRAGMAVPRSAPLVVGLGAVVLIALALAMTSDVGEGLQALFGRLAGGAAGNAQPGELRRFLWAGAWAAFLDHPLAGVGPDCLALAFGRYRTAAAWSAEWGQTPLKAHSQVLEVLATRGLVGGAAALALLAGVFRAGLRAASRESRDPELAVVALAGLVAFLVHISFHFPTAAGTSLALTFAAVLSVLAREEPEPEGGSVRLGTGPGVAAAILAGVVLYGLVLVPLRADVLGQAGTVALRVDPRRAAALEREAVRLDPSRDVLWLRLAAALQAEGLAESEPRKRGVLEEARRAAVHGVGLVPVSAYNQAHLGTLFADLERQTPPLATRTEVEQAFAEALALDPNNADIQMAAANAALAAGDLGRARAGADRVSLLYPRFGPGRALAGAAALVEGRRLAASGRSAEARVAWDEAVKLLREGLAGDWHGDETAHAAAEANLASALEALGDPTSLHHD